MTKLPFVSTRFFVPSEWVEQETLDLLLTVQPRGREGENPPAPIPIYDDESYEGYIGVPIDWGLRVYGDRELYDDRTVNGTSFNPPLRPDPYHPSVHDPEAQKTFMEDMLDATDAHYTVLAQAATGTGKTVVALRTAAELGKSTLVIVPTKVIARQWVDAAVNLLGMDRKDIGMVSGAKCPYDKPLCVGTVRSVSSKDYPTEFYHAFGLVIWDEVHRYASPKWSATLYMFPSAHKLALSATVGKRKDQADAVYLHQFGDSRVTSASEALPCKVHVMKYTASGRVYSGDDRHYALKALQNDDTRNLLLLKLMSSLYSHGRNVLAVGESIGHIEGLVGSLIDMGVPKGDVGQFTAQHTTEKGTRAPTDTEYLDWCKRVPRIVLGTYGMLKEGADVPRWDAGVELTPRTEATQLLGRVRRPFENKASALWYSILDARFGMFHGFLKSRQRDYYADPQITVIRHDN